MRYSQVYYITGSNMDSITSGSSVNDYKFFSSIPKKYKPILIYPKENSSKKLTFKSYLIFILKILKLSISYSKIFIIRSLWLGWILAFLKKIMKHKIILNMGCTPFYSIENLILRNNPQYSKNNNKLVKLFFLVIFQFEKFLTRKSNKIIVENNKAKNLIKKYGVNESKVFVAPYYVQDYFLTTKNLKFDFPKKKPLIFGYTGRFHQYDQLEPLIDAMQILKMRDFSFFLKLVGDGPTKLKIQNKVQSLKLENNVIFLGIRKHNEVSKIIDNTHVLILPMVKNLCPSTTPIKILEGIIKGKIILTNNSGNIISLFKPYTKLVLNDFSNPNEISNKIIEIAKNYQDYSKLAQNLRNKHLKTHNRLYYSKQIEMVLNLLDE